MTKSQASKSNLYPLAEQARAEPGQTGTTRDKPIFETATSCRASRLSKIFDAATSRKAAQQHDDNPLPHAHVSPGVARRTSAVKKKQLFSYPACNAQACPTRAQGS